MMTIKDKLVHAATRYDVRQANRKPRKGTLSNGYNPYALPQYLARIDEVLADVAKGTGPREAIVRGFVGSLRQAMLKALGYPADWSDDGPLAYRPVSQD